MPIYYLEEQVRKGDGLLNDLIARQKPPTIQKFLKDHRRLLRAVLKKGYGYDTVAEAFEAVGVTLSVDVLEQALRVKRRGTRRRTSKEADIERSLQRSMTPEQAQQLLTALEALKQKKNGLTYEEVIDWHFESITAALEQGWEAADIMTTFAAGGLVLKCTPKTFMQGVKQVRRKRKEASSTVVEVSEPIKEPLEDEQALSLPAAEPSLVTRLPVPSQQRRDRIADEFNV